MMYGHMAAANHGWAIPTGQPARAWRLPRMTVITLPAFETWSRVAVGAGIGGVFGLTTLYPVFWLLLGGAIAPVLGLVRDRAPGELAV